MIEAQVQPTAAGAIVFDRALGRAPDEAWFDPAHWAALGRADAQAGGRGGVAFVDTPAGPCALRHYRRGGAVARFSADRYLWTGAERTRAFREFRLLAHAAGLGLPVPRPVAARYVRDGLRYRADLLTRRIEAVRTLGRRLAEGSLDAELAQRAGRTIARFHAASIWHADLNANNILADESGRVWLIDFDRGRVRRPQLAWQQANLARLRRSFDKLGARRQPGFDARFWHPLLAAYHETLSQARPAADAHGAAP
jgi:3-deoxy-D-manno-octulosonic acid kinase